MENRKGKQTFTNGDSYEGELKDDIMHGKGVYHYYDGHVYEGYFHNGVKCGQGI